MVESPGEVLLLRAPPGGVHALSPGIGRGLARSLFDPNGSPGRFGNGLVTCFWVGLGRRVRVPGTRLMERIYSGEISDVLDVGCAGALDPGLRRGDLVFSTADLPYDSRAPVPVLRRSGMQARAESIARDRGAACYAAPILTHDRAVIRREERLSLNAATGCAAVQMEHAWFVLMLRTRLPTAVFRRLRFTHLVLITDTVPDRQGPAAGSAWDAVRGYLLQGGRGVASLRRELLAAWPFQ